MGPSADPSPCGTLPGKSQIVNKTSEVQTSPSSLGSENAFLPVLLKSCNAYRLSERAASKPLMVITQRKTAKFRQKAASAPPDTRTELKKIKNKNKQKKPHQNRVKKIQFNIGLKKKKQRKEENIVHLS